MKPVTRRAGVTSKAKFAAGLPSGVMRTLSIVNFTDSGVRYTGPDGTAVIDDLAAGGYRVAAERDGYEMDGLPVAVNVQSGERSPVQILLRKKAE